MKSKTLLTTIQRLISLVCEADEGYVVAGEKGLDQDEPRDRGLTKGTRNLRVRQTVSLEDVDESIVENGDEDNPAILCTDQYSIYDGIGEIDGHLAINHDEHCVVGDAHVNSCENRHSFLHNWLRRFRGVSKHHLQGNLNFFSLTLNTDGWFEKILSTDFSDERR